MQSTIELAITIIGWISTCLTISVYIPQLVKTIRTRDTSGVSIWMYIILQVTAWIWVIYGSLIIVNELSKSNGDIFAGLPILITNIVVGFIGLGIIYIKIFNILKAKKNNLTEREYIDLKKAKNK